MSIVEEIRRRLNKAIAPLLGMAAVFYFAFHAIQGDRGLFSWWQIRQEIVRAESALQALQAKRADLENRVSLLRPEGIDPDLLEERARVMFNMGRPGEKVIILPKISTEDRSLLPSEPHLLQ
ncbi:FtsB family cell division protein [Haematospirillum jordaniae]|uniref:FtsB family cell division protein n=1 Tax=Haematospirillum jordaniae TaxID=1549855 RepID=UPI001FD7F5FE|nr:septum formation initiator family protein [Haematospirillum jordaniae]